MTVSKTCEALKRCDHLLHKEDCDGCGNLDRELAMKKKPKFVVGGWYQTRDGGSTHKVAGHSTAANQPWVSVDGTRWSEDGSYYGNGTESGFDLVRRVNPPVEYIPTKKWLWMREITLPDGVACKLITKEHSEIKPEGEWYDVPGSEVEE